MLALPVTATLPPTASRAERSVSYTVNTEPCTPHDGTLVVTEWAGKKVPRTITSTYLVCEVPPVGKGRRFEVVLFKCVGAAPSRAKASDQRAGSLYYAGVGPDGSGSCTCPAGEVNRECAHQRALSELIATGGLESPFEYGEPERYEWETEYANTNQGE